MLIIAQVIGTFLLLAAVAEASWKCPFCGTPAPTPAPAPSGCPNTVDTCEKNPCFTCCTNLGLCGSYAGCKPYCVNPAPAPAPSPYNQNQPQTGGSSGSNNGSGGSGSGGHSGGGSHGGGASVSKPKPKVDESKPKAKVVVVTKAALETKPKPKVKSNEKMLSPTRTPPHGPHDAYIHASSGPSPAGIVFGSALVFALAGLFVGEVRRNGWGRRRAVNVNTRALTRALSEDNRANASASDTPYSSA